MGLEQINNGQKGLSVRNALNSMLAQLYASISMPLKLANVSSNTQQVIPANTFLQAVSVSVSVISGTPTINIGTTGNGGEVIPTSELSGFTKFQIDQYFAAQQTLYITITGGTVSIRMDVLNSYY